jgi:peptide/nickel transport system permease protein
VLGVVAVSFSIMQLTPGDPIAVILGEFPASEETVRALRREFGLDEPLWRQLLIYLTRVFRADLGFSFVHREPVLRLILERLPATLLLSGAALLLATVVGTALGIASSRRPTSWLDALVSAVALLGFSMPVFWLGQLLIVVLSLEFGWLPAQGMVSLRSDPSGWARALSVAHHLVLPSLTLSASFLALNSRITRTSMLEVLRQEYITVARAKGLSEARVVYVHALRNAILPLVTVVGFNCSYLLAGSAFVETIFAWPGIGRLLYDSVLARDHPLILGVFLVVSIGVILINLLTDVAYAYLDPRVRY